MDDLIKCDAGGKSFSERCHHVILKYFKFLANSASCCQYMSVLISMHHVMNMNIGQARVNQKRILMEVGGESLPTYTTNYRTLVVGKLQQLSEVGPETLPKF